jgi:ribosome-associated protein
MKTPQELEPDDRPGTPLPSAGTSKSQKKRDMHALQELGTALVELSTERLARVDMPDTLREAILQAQRITAHEGRRRQMQYIGRLMRDVDPAPMREALAVVKGASAAETARLHRVERLRERLLEDEAVLTEIGRDHPGADLSRLRQLRRGVLREREAGRPVKGYRELFRTLRELDE